MTRESTNDLTYFGARIAEEKVELVREILDHGEQSRIIRKVVEVIIESGGFERNTVYDSRIEKRKEDFQELIGEKEKIEEQIEEIQTELDNLQTRRDESLSTEERYQIALKTVEQPFRAGEFGHLDDDHPQIQTIARDHGKSTEAVHADLRERNPDLPEYAFKEWRAVHQKREKFEGLPEEMVDTSLDEREALEGPDS